MAWCGWSSSSWHGPGPVVSISVGTDHEETKNHEYQPSERILKEYRTELLILSIMVHQLCLYFAHIRPALSETHNENNYSLITMIVHGRAIVASSLFVESPFHRQWNWLGGKGLEFMFGEINSNATCYVHKYGVVNFYVLTSARLD